MRARRSFLNILFVANRKSVYRLFVFTRFADVSKTISIFHREKSENSFQKSYRLRPENKCQVINASIVSDFSSFVLDLLLTLLLTEPMISFFVWFRFDWLKYSIIYLIVCFYRIKFHRNSVSISEIDERKTGILVDSKWSDKRMLSNINFGWLYGTHKMNGQENDIWNDRVVSF